LHGNHYGLVAVIVINPPVYDPSDLAFVKSKVRVAVPVYGGILPIPALGVNAVPPVTVMVIVSNEFTVLVNVGVVTVTVILAPLWEFVTIV